MEVQVHMETSSMSTSAFGPGIKLIPDSSCSTSFEASIDFGSFVQDTCISACPMPSRSPRNLAPFDHFAGGTGRCWDSGLWLKARDQVLSTGERGSIKLLQDFVNSSTQAAISAGHYYTSPSLSSSRVSLEAVVSHSVQIQWFGREHIDPNLEAIGTKLHKICWFGREHLDPELRAQEYGVLAPSVVVHGSSSLDFAVRLVQEGTKDVALVVEAVAFDEVGRLDLSRVASIFPECLNLRSDFARFVESALRQARVATAKQHLQAEIDPYVLLCKGVTIFRGSKEDGYPLMSSPVKLNLIVISQCSNPPSVRKTTEPGLPGVPLGAASEWYGTEYEQTALGQRLHLVAAGIAQQLSDLDARGIQPTLVLSPPGCGFHLHPKNAVASAFRQFRRRFSCFFSQIHICTHGRACFGSEEARYVKFLQVAINSDTVGSGCRGGKFLPDVSPRKQTMRRDESKGSSACGGEVRDGIEFDDHLTSSMAFDYDADFSARKRGSALFRRYQEVQSRSFMAPEMHICRKPSQMGKDTAAQSAMIRFEMRLKLSSRRNTENLEKLEFDEEV